MPNHPLRIVPVVMLLVAACATDTAGVEPALGVPVRPASPAAAADTPLTGAPWVVEDIAGRGIIDYSRVTLQFADEGHLSGSASCNDYHAGYQVSGRAIHVSPAVTTRKACVPALMNQEAEFLRILEQAWQHSLAADGALVIESSTGETILARRS